MRREYVYYVNPLKTGMLFIQTLIHHPFANMSNEEAFLDDFLEILKHPLQNL